MDCDLTSLPAGSACARPSLARAWTPAERVCEVWRDERGCTRCWVVLWGLLSAALGARPGAIPCVSPALPGSGSRAPPGALAAAEPVTPARGSSSSSSAHPSLPQQANMAAESEWRCLICGDTRDGAAYVNPCHHQFCLGCIVRWANRKASCPLCRQTVKSITYSVRSEEDFLEMTFWQRPSRASVAGHQDEQRAANPVPVGGLLPRVWAGLFRDCRKILEPLMSWLRRQLRQMYRERWWVVDLAQATIISHLCHYGPDEEALVRKLQRSLRHQTVTFVHQLVAVVAEWCREHFMQLLELLDSQAAEEQEHSPTATPGPAAAPGDTPAPDPRAQEEPREELGQAVAGPSTAGQGRECSPGGPRRRPKRKASCSQDSSADKQPRRQ